MEDEEYVDGHLLPSEENRVRRAHKISNASPKALDEDSPLLDYRGSIKSYKSRWYVLVVFSYAALLQTGLWNTFGPIAQSAKAVFGWTDANIGMLNNWGNIMSVVFMFPMAWLLDVKGLRISMLLCAVLMVFLTAIRCITSEAVAATWLINIAAIVNGVAGTVPSAGPALLSATWFPPKERATATAVSTVFFYLGMSIGFIIGPLLAPQPEEQSLNMTDTLHMNSSSQGKSNSFNVTSPANLSEMRSGIMRLMYIECAACVLLLFLVVVYFPAKPPSPPSLTASMERTSYLQGLKGLFTHKRFLVIMVAFSVPTGVSNAFGAVLDVVLDGIGITQYHAGWIGFYATTGACVVALLMSRIVDLFLRHMKMLLLVLFVLATTATLWFVLLRLSFIPFSMMSLYISCILMGVFISGGTPLFYELGCEASYPIAEGVTVGVLTLANNLIGVIFLSVLQIPKIASDYKLTSETQRKTIQSTPPMSSASTTTPTSFSSPVSFRSDQLQGCMLESIRNSLYAIAQYEIRILHVRGKCVTLVVHFLVQSICLAQITDHLTHSFVALFSGLGKSSSFVVSRGQMWAQFHRVGTDTEFWTHCMI